MKFFLGKFLIVGSLLFTGIIVVIFFLFIGIPKSIANGFEEIQCSGIIENIQPTQSCFFKIEVNKQNDEVDLDVSSCCGSKYDEFFKFIAIRDSIKKEKGKLLLTVKKMNTGETKEFEYPFCIE